VSELQSSLFESVTFTAGYESIFDLFGASFSASTSYQSASTAITSKNTVLVSTHAKCGTYVAKLEPGYHVNVTTNFRDAVEGLPVVFDNTTDNVFFNFLTNFGTHYSTELSMGASATLQYSLTTEAYSSLQSSNVDIEVGAQLNFLGFYGSITTKHEYGYKDYEAFKNATSSFEVLGLGLQPPLTANASSWTAWENEISGLNNPVPVFYQLASIADLLTADYFPNDPYITARAAALVTALANYCASLSHCTVPPAPVPVAPWGQYGHDAQRSFRSAYAGPATLPSVKWSVNLNVAGVLIGANDIIIVTACISDESCETLFVVALSNIDGSTLWTLKNAIAMYTMNGTVFATQSSDTLESTYFAVGLTDGLYRYTVGTFNTLSVFTDDIALAINGSNAIMVNLATCVSDVIPISNAYDIILSPDGATVYILASFSTVYALKWGTWSVKWIYNPQHDGTAYYFIGSTDEAVFIAMSSKFEFVVTLNATNGQLLWTYSNQTTSDWNSVITAIGHDLLLINLYDKLIAIDSTTDLVKWSIKTPVASSMIVDANNIVFFLGTGGLTMANATNGTVSWIYNAGCLPLAIDSTGALLANCGTLVALE